MHVRPYQHRRLFYQPRVNGILLTKVNFRGHIGSRNFARAKRAERANFGSVGEKVTWLACNFVFFSLALSYSKASVYNVFSPLSLFSIYTSHYHFCHIGCKKVRNPRLQPISAIPVAIYYMQISQLFEVNISSNNTTMADV